jgi:hypothetical protein
MEAEWWRRGRRWLGALCAAVATATALGASACGLVREEEPLPTPEAPVGNLLTNAGFEDGLAPWQSDVSLTTSGQAHSGASSLALASAESAAQTVAAGQLPEFISGFYRVDHWEGDDDSFFEFAVTARADGGPGTAVRFAIAGVQQEPEGVPPDSLFFLSRDVPETGSWVYFAYPLHDAFVRKVGGVPTPVASVDVAFGVHGTNGATVLFDDVFLGAQADNPNRPPEAEGRLALGSGECLPRCGAAR